MQGPYLRKYGVETKINFVLYEVDGVDLRVDAADGGTDCTIMKDEGAEATATNDFVDEGMGYSLTLAAGEMEAARIVIYVVDSAAKVWLDESIVVETYGNASAMHAFDLDTASVAQGADNNTILSSMNIANGAVESDLTYIHGSALTETAGQLAAAFIKFFDVATPVLTAESVDQGADNNIILAHADYGNAKLARTGADSDTLETLSDQIDGTNTVTPPTVTEIQAEMEENGASILDTLRDDLADGGRLDLLIDAIKAQTDLVTAARMGVLSDWINGGRLDLILDIIAADTTTDIPAKLLKYIQLLTRSDAAIETDNATELTAINADGGSGAGNFSAQAEANEALRDQINLQATVAICTEARLAELDAANLPTDVAACSTHDAAGVKTAIEAGGSYLALIKAVTDVLPNSGALTDIDTNAARLTAARAGVLTDWINGGRLDVLLDAIPTTAMRGTDSAATEAKQDIIDTNIDTLLTRITAAVALASVCTEARLAELDAANIPADIDTLKTRLSSANAQAIADLIDGGRLDVIFDAIKAVTDALTAAAAAKLALSAGTIVAGTVSHDNTAATTTVFYSDDIVEATADHYNGRIVIFTSGALQYQATDITGYALDTGEGKFTVTALTEAPADNVTFIII